MKSVRTSKKNGYLLLSAQGSLEDAPFVSFAELNTDAPSFLATFAAPASSSVLSVPDPLPAELAQQCVSINALKTELLHVHERGKLVHLLAHYLPLLAIQSAAIFFTDQNGQTQYAGGFTTTGDVQTEPQLFSSAQLVPDSLAPFYKKGLYVVQPLTAHGSVFGYVILGNAACDSFVYEDIRNVIGSTIQNIHLFEELTAARKTAEQAVREKTEFFANVGSDLCDPLKDLSAKITQMESNVEKGILNADILSEQLLFLKSQVTSQLEKTETLVELTRTQVDDLPMDKKLFHVASVLPQTLAKTIPADVPLLFGDTERLQKAMQILLALSQNNVSVTATLDGVHLAFESAHFDWQNPKLLLAEKIILLQYGDIIKSDFSATVILPYPNLAGLAPVKKAAAQKIYAFGTDADKKTLLHLPVKTISKDAITAADSQTEPYLFYWNPETTAIDVWVTLYGLRHNEKLSRVPLLCYSKSLMGQTFMQVLEQKVSTQKKATVLFVNTKQTRYGTWATEENSVVISSMADFDNILEEVVPALIVFESVDEPALQKIRQNPRTVLVPIFVFPDKIASEEDVDLLCAYPRIILCNRGAAKTKEFEKRVQEILGGDEILPSHTGALVKKAILYLNKNVSQQIVRWKLADTVHVSEDYLTRIFHKEIGLSLWEYLNQYRIFLAEKMLLETNDTIYEIAENTGFQDQAYFCRVFKRIYGVSPGKIRTKQ